MSVPQLQRATGSYNCHSSFNSWLSFFLHPSSCPPLPCYSRLPDCSHRCVVFADLDGEDLELGHEGRDAAEALPSATSNAHQQRIAIRLLDDAAK